MAGPSFPLRVACIDVGSNGLRCVAAEFQDATRHRILLQERAPVRLGQSVFEVGAIDTATMDAAVEALAGFKRLLDPLGIQVVRAVATSAVREAANQDQFLRKVRRAAGLKVEVISGAEEARLVAAAVARHLPLDGDPWIMMDLGGGSVEIGLLDAGGLLWSESHPMGSVRLLEEFHAVQGDPAKFGHLVAETVHTLRINLPRGRKPAGFAATGGNIEELARLAGCGDDEVAQLPIKKLREQVQRLTKMSLEERRQVLGLRPDRADVIVPAGLVYEHVADLLGADTIHVPHVGLKDGVLYDLVDSVAVHTDPQAKTEHVVLDASVALGRRYQFEEPHGVQVSRLALSLFDQTQGLHRLRPADRLLLQAAAVLHDVGRFVNDHKHHKHSYYLIAQADLPGLSGDDVEVVAQVARYHRRKEPTPSHKPFAKLSGADQERVTRLAALLRVADALDRQHRGAVRGVKVRLEKDAVVLRLRGQGDLALEQWAVQEKGGLFCATFDTTIELETEA
ncbi:MAG: exopolyphosphatase / guanosine-5-triphosphate,3-diphosphate pyrophosphatase [Thermoplasmata archaeon]|jgi:exopolyphosphatase/guanosine-5'-triphosphate,3'-diphosphate pyrophosphatase|nr:exopolyphosphatase / guanosine-5-triphosphate,3-diphosphate pyrophosphatase [Thermoplasmata archaeon]